MSADPSTPESVLRKLHDAMNRHDLEAFLDCFHPEYRSEQPVHPDRAFTGVEQVRQNWSAIFRGVPDFHARLIRFSVDGDEFWAEWSWEGTRTSGNPVEMPGVTVFGVRDGRILWGRLYMEPVATATDGAGASAAEADVEELDQGPRSA
jgi:ketosteroid isomerase-like protein